MYRALSYLITGTEAHYLGVWAAIVSHLLQHDELLMCSAKVGVNAHYVSMSQYIRRKEMDKNGKWGSEVELFAVCRLLRTQVYTYLRASSTWKLHAPSDIDPSLEAFKSDTDMGMYLYHADHHYMNVVKLFVASSLVCLQTSCDKLCTYPWWH